MTSASSGARCRTRGRQLHQDLAGGSPGARPACVVQPIGVGAGRAAGRRCTGRPPLAGLPRRRFSTHRRRTARTAATSTVDRAGVVQHDLFVPDRQQPVGLGAERRRACGGPRTGSDAGSARRPPVPGPATAGPAPARDGDADRAPARASPPGPLPCAAATGPASTALPSTCTVNAPSSWMRSSRWADCTGEDYSRWAGFVAAIRARSPQSSRHVRTPYVRFWVQKWRLDCAGMG